MENSPFVQSLISYLDSTKHPFALKIAFPAKTPDSPGKAPNPFILLKDTDPLTRLFMAKLVTTSGSGLKDLYLLVQRDQYQVSEDIPYPCSNTDVERTWQDAKRHFAGSHGGGSGFISWPVSGEGIITFQPLFYCAFRDQFFHPICPACGGLLELCTDDALLESTGIPPYSSSLHRHLYCPSCTGTEKEPMFFAPGKGKNESSSLSDLPALVKGFGKILGTAKGSFPCSSCPETKACFGPQGKAGDRIIPFSFFPFHLMVFDSYPVDALDYLNTPSSQGAVPPGEVHDEAVGASESRPVPPAAKPEDEEAPSVVIDVLLGLRKKWAAALPQHDEQPTAKEPEKTPGQEIQDLPVDMLEKTMIFSPAQMENAPSPAEPQAETDTPQAPPKPPQHPAGEVVLEKTMIFSPGSAPAPPLPTEKPSGKAAPVGGEHRESASEEILEKTVISTPNGKRQDVPKQKKKTGETEAIPETVIMSLDDLKGKK